MDQVSDDVRAIEELIARQFGVMNWSPESPTDWAAFADDFLPSAMLFPAARPVQPRTVPAFVERMKGLSTASLRSFAQSVLRSEIRVFGNVAIAMAACRNTENETAPVRGVEAMMLIKQDGARRIVARAWDIEDENNAVPGALLAAGSTS